MPILRAPGSTPSLYQNHGLNVRFKRPFYAGRNAQQSINGAVCYANSYQNTAEHKTGL